MRKAIYFFAGMGTLAIVLAGSGFAFLKTRTHGFSARDQPTALEAFAAHSARELALPSEARDKRNPVAFSDDVLTEAREHWADHCASCHANDGSGQIQMGQQMYPPAPDMRKESTQGRTDGELFYIIENGIRLSGMPAWGGSAHGQQDSWKLVHFIRHLPSLSASEINEMEALNPKSPGDLEEEKQEEEFLKGQSIDEPATQNHHP
jgi:mono/diheme cytochrome c family protein